MTQDFARVQSDRVTDDIMELKTSTSSGTGTFNGEICYRDDGLGVVLKNSQLNCDVTSFIQDANSNNSNNSDVTIRKNTEQSGVGGHHPLIPKYLTLLDSVDASGDAQSSERSGLTTDRPVSGKRSPAAPSVQTFRVHTFPDDVTQDKDDEIKEIMQRVSVRTWSQENGVEKVQGKQILMCFQCRLTFALSTSLTDHIITNHDVKLNKHEQKLLKSSQISAFLQKKDDSSHVVCFLEPTDNFTSSKEREVDQSESVTVDSQITAPIRHREGTECLSAETDLTSDTSKSHDITSENVHETNLNNKTLDVACSVSISETTNDFTKLEPETGNPAENITSPADSDKPLLIPDTKENIVTSQTTIVKGNDVAEGVLDLSSPSKLTDLPGSGNSVGTESHNQDMSFALASPLGVHASPPTSHPLLMSNVMRTDALNRDAKIALMKPNDSKSFSSKSEHQDTDAQITNSSRSIVTSPLENATHLVTTSNSAMLPSSIPDAQNRVNSIAASLVASQGLDVLSSSPSNAEHIFPMSLFQSRNSCKTLKCPKCNWHYKYRQTLEAHMKEKHLEETSDCAYCNAGQPHPRLSRGESYSCGYKPFKCSVCNYSTTTKGNLSIHMQSDKHLYNARTLQHRQQDKMRHGVSPSSSSFNAPGSDVSTHSENIQRNALKRSYSPNKHPTYNDTMLDLKQFNSTRRRRSSNKTNSSIDSSTFTAPSKTGSPTIGRRDAGTGGKWRCDVCTYETSIARNLRIHMTSEKHAQNLALRERGLLKTSRPNEDSSHGRAERSKSNDTSRMLPFVPQNLMEYYAAAFKSLQEQDGRDDVTRGFPHLDDSEKARKVQAQYLQQQLLLAQHQQLLLAQQYQQFMVAAAASSLQQRLSNHSKEDDVSNFATSQERERMRQLEPSEVKSSCIFSCGLCLIYGTDDINALDAHVRKPRHSDVTYDMTNSEWVTRSQREGYFCKLCSYSTPLKTNFNLHCKTEKHTCKLNLISHIREGGAATEWMIPIAISGNMMQNVTCNACNFTTHSVEKLKLHCSTDQHQGVFTVCQYLHNVLKSRSSDDSSKEKKSGLTLNCLACGNFSTTFVVEMVKHMQTNEHQVQLQNHKNPPMSTLQDVISIEERDVCKTIEQKVGSPSAAGKAKSASDRGKRCEFCNYVSDDESRMQLHVMMQHSDQPPLECPICKELVKGPIQWQLHMIEVHNMSLASLGQMDDKAQDLTKTTIKEEIGGGESKEIVAISEVKDAVKTQEANNDISDELAGELKIDEGIYEEPIAMNQESSEKINLPSRIVDADARSAEKRTVQSDSLILKVLKGQDVIGNCSEKRKTAPDHNNNSVETGTEKEVFPVKIERHFAEQGAVFAQEDPQGTVTRSCPDLLASATNGGAFLIADSFPASDKRVKTKRSRIRSYPLDGGSRSRAYRDLLSKYGLEQATHYIENRSPENRHRARSFKQDQQKWASLSDDGLFPEETRDVQEGESARSRNETNKENLQNRISHQNCDELDNEDTPKVCRQCGKEFTGVWVLKAHEEETHGVCVPAQNIQKLSSAYSDQILGRIKDDVTGNDTTPIGENVKQTSTHDSANLAEGASGASTVPNQAETSALQNKMNAELAAMQQQLQQQALLKALFSAQVNKQNSTPGILGQFENMNPAMYMGDPMSGNLLSSMGLYTSLLQAQASTLSPYQMLANAAAVQQMQQMQQLGGNSMIGITDDNAIVKGSQVFGANAQTNTVDAKHSRACAFDALQEQAKQIQQVPPQLTQSTQKLSAVSAEIPAKRPRTRITDEQLKILRANFDINNSPSEEQIEKMANQTCLPPKVIKHWFRNTLFKERQRSKDSPYNFNIPPITSLDDAYKTSSATSANHDHDVAITTTSNKFTETNSSKMLPDIKPETADTDQAKPTDKPTDLSFIQTNKSFSDVNINKEKDSNRLTAVAGAQEVRQALFTNALALMPNLPDKEPVDENEKPSEISGLYNQSPHSILPQRMLDPIASWQALTNYEISSANDMHYHIDSQSLPDTNPPSSHAQGIACRRTPRTRFTDHQLQVLQDFFDHNAYPKDDDLDKLSQTLNLSTRVIVVWFQNARQKARKSYEQQQPNLNPLSMGRVRSLSPNFEEIAAKTRRQNAPVVEDLARRTLSEVTKTMTQDGKLQQSLTPANASLKVLASADDADFQFQEKMSKSPPLSECEYQSKETLITCQMCEQKFSSQEEWQVHQQSHFAANVASMFSPYGMMYMQGLMGNARPQLFNEKALGQTSGVKEENNKIFNLEKESESSSSRGNWEGNLSFSDDKSVSSLIRSRLITPPMSSSSKRKISTSPTLSMSSSSSTSPSIAQGGVIRAKGNFLDDKECVGLQKDPKRLRTTITPEQLEYLYQQYLVDSSPSRKIIEQISEVVGLKKRVVQVWFQNTRARERKGQFRSSVARGAISNMNQYKLCHLCRMVFRSKTELDLHIQTRHGSQEENRFSQDEPVNKKIKFTDLAGLARNSAPAQNAAKVLSSYDPDRSINMDIDAIKKLTNTMTPENISHIKQEVLPLEAPDAQTRNEAANRYSPLASNTKAAPTNTRNTTDLQKLVALYSSADFASGTEKLTTTSPDTPRHSTHYDKYDKDETSLLTSIGQPRGNEGPSANEASQSGRNTSPVMSLKQDYSENRISIFTSQTKLSPSQRSTAMTSNPHATYAPESVSTTPKRYRTQMTANQVKALKHSFKGCKMPTLAECETLGNELGLQKRVIQVWFQNARAKEKKHKMIQQMEGNGVERTELNEESHTTTHCDVCFPIVRYTSLQHAREHIFSHHHLQRLLLAIDNDGSGQFSPAGLNACSSSSGSSYDGTESQFQADQTGFGSAAERSPIVLDQNDVSVNKDRTSSINGFPHDEDVSVGRSLSTGSGSTNIEKKSKDDVTSDPAKDDYSALLAENPVLLQQFALQQMMQHNQENDPEESGSETPQKQAMLQQALQKSLYQMLKLTQGSSSGN
ncbi:zinc finger homeobox protein 4-like isoform X2 [Clavelina lepadiformis]|uniref:zinc finger homeobox protein 4-like isoform X2 n=1 Tax=Clavelina lepadiformis TaxID=159417 RepID=UPI00404291FD